MDYSQSLSRGLGDINMDQGRRAREVYKSQIALPHLLSGQATWFALQRAVNDLVARAPKDNDVLLRAFDLTVD